MPAQLIPAESDRIEVSVPSQFGHAMAEYAQAKIGSVLRGAAERARHVRVRLSVHADPAVPRPVVAQANLDLNGRHIRTQVGGRTARDAVDALHDGLCAKLSQMAPDRPAPADDRWSARRHEWSRHMTSGHRPDYFPRPIGERQVMRHKEVTLSTRTVDQAASDMDLLDYDFHLFTEAGSSQDSLLRWAGTDLRLAQAEPTPHLVTPGSLPVDIGSQPPPRLNLPDAVHRLDLSAQPFLFYVDTQQGRGCLLYRRYDGHYGLIVPAR
jgi:hypothetical protein